MSTGKYLLGAVLLLVFVAAAGLFLEKFSQSEPKTTEFSVRNFFEDEYGKVNVTYTQPLDQYKACLIAGNASQLTHLTRFTCSTFLKSGENWQIGYMPNEQTIYLFTIYEKEKKVVMTPGMAQ